ncbi:hypothetical protein GCM10022226_79000 [Sphaerisporangium flaviroseum]|uniref:Uncharacterized protein n=1 Tax=Sphaerisporangium flaviroseum TaxID=509199 RepID=A0ABP7JHA7_9ACTN
MITTTVTDGLVLLPRIPLRALPCHLRWQATRAGERPATGEGFRAVVFAGQGIGSITTSPPQCSQWGGVGGQDGPAAVACLVDHRRGGKGERGLGAGWAEGGGDARAEPRVSSEVEMVTGKPSKTSIMSHRFSRMLASAAISAGAGIAITM